MTRHVRIPVHIIHNGGRRMAEVKLRGVKKSFGDVEVIHGVNLTARDGEFVVFVGPSGCGKSTLLRMIAGLESVTGGDVLLDGERINDHEPVDRGMAMVFQSYALYPHMTVAQNMGFSLRLARRPKEEIRQKVEAAAKILQMEHLLARTPRELSGGQKQRVAIGRAIVRDPKVFLFDEPLSNLDAKMRVEMRKEILQLHRRIKATMIYVTHDQVEAMTLGDRICVLKDGLLQQMGTPTEVFDNPANMFTASFIGTPPMNLIQGRLEKTGADRIRFSGSGLEAVLPQAIGERVAGYIGAEVSLGLRPKAITLASLASGEDAETVWKVDVAVTEMLGEEALLHVSRGDARFILNVDPHALPGLGEEVEVCPLLTRAHIFLSESEENLTRDLNLPGRYSVRQ